MSLKLFDVSLFSRPHVTLSTFLPVFGYFLNLYHHSGPGKDNSNVLQYMALANETQVKATPTVVSQVDQCRITPNINCKNRHEDAIH